MLLTDKSVWEHSYFRQLRVVSADYEENCFVIIVV